MTGLDQQQAPSDAHAGLARGISAPRFGTFLAAAEGDEHLARELYVWNRDLSVAFLADIAILEVALRNAMHDAAVAAWGTHWYADTSLHLDVRSTKALEIAWKRLHDSVKNRPQDDDVPGRLVAQCMFGFWTGLLDAGGYIGAPPRRSKADYETLWHAAFKHAFPGGRGVARTQRETMRATVSAGEDTTRLNKEIAFTRPWMHGICKTVNDLRNRVSHHEPLVNGFPRNGQSRRMTATEGREMCQRLAGALDRDLATWLTANSTVPALLSQRPGHTAQTPAPAKAP